MDINTIRIITMLVSLALFVVLVICVFRRSAQAELKQAASLIFESEAKERSHG